MDAFIRRASPSASSTAVLVVDDDDNLRSIVSSLLCDEGYTVLEAPDGVSALEQLRTQPSPLIVLLDWFMPGMDGLGVLRALAGDASIVEPRMFIVLSAADLELRRQLSREMTGIPSRLSVTVMGKPFDLDDLLDHIARAAAHLAAHH